MAINAQAAAAQIMLEFQQSSGWLLLVDPSNSSFSEIALGLRNQNGGLIELQTRYPARILFPKPVILGVNFPSSDLDSDDAWHRLFEPLNPHLGRFSVRVTCLHTEAELIDKLNRTVAEPDNIHELAVDGKVVFGPTRQQTEFTRHECLRDLFPLKELQRIISAATLPASSRVSRRELFP